MRLFVAINPPVPERERIYRDAAELRALDMPLRWVEREAVHLTLKFLGEVAADRVAEVATAVDRVVAGFAPFELVVRGFGAFPSPRRPRVVWAGVDASETLKGVQRGIEEALEPIGFEPERRAFHPHITLARARRDAAPRRFAGLEDVLATAECDVRFDVRAVDVMSSRLTPQGALYDVQQSSTLTP